MLKFIGTWKHLLVRLYETCWRRRLERARQKVISVQNNDGLPAQSISMKSSALRRVIEKSVQIELCRSPFSREYDRKHGCLCSVNRARRPNHDNCTTFRWTFE